MLCIQDRRLSFVSCVTFVFACVLLVLDISVIIKGCVGSSYEERGPSGPLRGLEELLQITESCDSVMDCLVCLKQGGAKLMVRWPRINGIEPLLKALKDTDGCSDQQVHIYSMVAVHKERGPKAPPLLTPSQGTGPRAYGYRCRYHE